MTRKVAVGTRFNLLACALIHVLNESESLHGLAIYNLAALMLLT